MYNITSYLIYKDVTGNSRFAMFFQEKCTPPERSVLKFAGKFVWQILYRTKEKCLETIIGYVTKKLAKWFGRDSCVKLKQIEAKFNQNVLNLHVRFFLYQRACWLSPWIRCQVRSSTAAVHCKVFQFCCTWGVYFSVGYLWNRLVDLLQIWTRP